MEWSAPFMPEHTWALTIQVAALTIQVADPLPE